MRREDENFLYGFKAGLTARRAAGLVRRAPCRFAPGARRPGGGLKRSGAAARLTRRRQLRTADDDQDQDDGQDHNEDGANLPGAAKQREFASGGQGRCPWTPALWAGDQAATAPGPSRTEGNQTAPAPARSYVQWGAPPCRGGGGPVGASLHDGQTPAPHPGYCCGSCCGGSLSGSSYARPIQPRGTPKPSAMRTNTS